MVERENTKSSIADVLLVVSKHLGLIIISAIIGVIYTVVYLNITHEPEYTSTCTVYVPADEYGSSRSDLGVLATQFGITSRKSAGTDITSFLTILFDGEGWMVQRKQHTSSRHLCPTAESKRITPLWILRQSRAVGMSTSTSRLGWIP